MAKKSNTSKRGIARMYIEKHPNHNFSDFVKNTKNKNDINIKDFSNAVQFLKSKNKKADSLDELYTELPISKKHPIISKYVIENPKNTYNSFKKDYPNYKINPTCFSHLRCKTLKSMDNGSAPSKKFKQKLITIVSQPALPDFKNKDDVLDWVNKEILDEINKSQSVCKFDLVRFAYPENTLELRKRTAR